MEIVTLIQLNKRIQYARNNILRQRRQLTTSSERHISVRVRPEFWESVVHDYLQVRLKLKEHRCPTVRDNKLPRAYRTATLKGACCLHCNKPI